MAASGTRTGSRRMESQAFAIRELAMKLSSQDLEELEGNLKKLEQAVKELRATAGIPAGRTATEERRFHAASPASEAEENQVRGPSVTSERSEI